MRNEWQNAITQLSNIDIDFATILPGKVIQLLAEKNISPAQFNTFLGNMQKQLNLTQLAAQAMYSLTDFVPPGQRCALPPTCVKEDTSTNHRAAIAILKHSRKPLNRLVNKMNTVCIQFTSTGDTSLAKKVLLRNRLDIHLCNNYVASPNKLVPPQHGPPPQQRGELHVRRYTDGPLAVFDSVPNPADAGRGGFGQQPFYLHQLEYCRWLLPGPECCDAEADSRR